MTEMFCMYGTKGDKHSELISFISDVPSGLEDMYQSIEVADINGTPKQIAWAKSIRSDMMLKVSKERQYLRSVSVADKKDMADVFADAAVEKICGEASARWFIDNRGKSALKIIEEAAMPLM